MNPKHVVTIVQEQLNDLMTQHGFKSSKKRLATWDRRTSERLVMAMVSCDLNQPYHPTFGGKLAVNFMCVELPGTLWGFFKSFLLPREILGSLSMAKAVAPETYWEMQSVQKAVIERILEHAKQRGVLLESEKAQMESLRGELTEALPAQSRESLRFLNEGDVRIWAALVEKSLPPILDELIAGKLRPRRN